MRDEDGVRKKNGVDCGGSKGGSSVLNFFPDYYNILITIPPFDLPLSTHTHTQAHVHIHIHIHTMYIILQ